MTRSATEDAAGVQQIIRWLYRAAGAGVAITLMELLARIGDDQLSRLPFVTSIVLTIALPDSDGAQPYAVIAGHLISTIAGFAALWCLGPGATACAAGVGLATLLMLAARAVHPPAGIDAFLVPLFGLPIFWLINPVLIGAVLLAGFARLWSAGETPLLRPFRTK
jgi:CBS-domain-containing membrane protein